MALEKIVESVRFGLEFERMRIEASSQNIARANVPYAAGGTASLAQVEAPAGRFAVALGSGIGHPSVVEVPTAAREVHEPGNPLADAKGMVSYPAVDMAGEMTTLMSATRSYEANVRAFNVLHAMELHSLDIGAKS
jgi:flagellar basal-body rod protein FlgC